MTLLELQRVKHSYTRAADEDIVLRNVSLELDEGELVAIWGRRRSGRSTLLRVAAGLERPDAGVVRFAGRDLSTLDGDVLGGGIGYCRFPPLSAEDQSVLEGLLVGQLARGVAQRTAQSRALTALERTGTRGCATLRARELDSAETVRVTLARALVLQPLLLVIDEPTKSVELLERDAILSLLRSLADDGTAILMSAGESTALTGADRALSLSDGELRGNLRPELAPLLELRRHASA